MVFDATFNNISVISWQSILLVEETAEQTTKPAASHWQTLSHIMLYRVHLAWIGFKLTTLVVIGAYCISIYKSNYHIYMIMNMTALPLLENHHLFSSRKGSLRVVVSLEGYNLVVFYNLSTCTSKIFSDKRGGLWWEGPLIRGGSTVLIIWYWDDEHLLNTNN